MIISLLALASGLTVAQPASTTAAPVTPTNPQSIVQLLQSEGYKAQLDKDGTGDPMIVSAANGAKFAIYFYDCENNEKCESIQFRAAYTTPKDKKLGVEKMHEFNQKWRFGKAYLDSDLDPAIDFDVAFGTSMMPAPMFVDVLGNWVQSMGKFQQHIDW